MARRRGGPKWAKDKFHPKNPSKYVGNGVPTYRSSWELSFMNFCDNNPNVLEWASEPMRIPYRHPLTGKQTVYVPDFLIRYRERNNKIKTELIEIKPYKQSVIEGRMNANARATVAINQAKWEMARAWCKRQGITFRVITEKDMFRQ